MSHFYAKIYESNRTNAPTARGHKSTGVACWAGSYEGIVDVRVIYDPARDMDMVRVTLEDHPDKNTGLRHVLYEGPLDASNRSTITTLEEVAL